MYKKILVPIMLDDAHDPSQSFTVAKALGGDDTQYMVVHVHEPIPSYAFAEIPADYLAETRSMAATALKKAAEPFPEAQTELVIGHAGRGILDYADANGFDCIIIASHRPGLSDYFLGSTAGHVVRHAKCGVHVLR